MKSQLLESISENFPSVGKAPSNLFDPCLNEPTENPDWMVIYSNSWDDIPVSEIKRNWDAFMFFSDEALLYFLPTILKYAISEPEETNLLQGFFLRALTGGSIFDRIVSTKLNSHQIRLIMDILESVDYQLFCENYGFTEDWNSALINLKSNGVSLNGLI